MWSAASTARLSINTGSNIKPAPCAVAIRNDHTVKSRKPTCIRTQELKAGFPCQTSFELLESSWTSRFIGVCRLVSYSGCERGNDLRRWNQSSAEPASQKDGEHRQNGQPKPEEHLDK